MSSSYPVRRELQRVLHAVEYGARLAAPLTS
jgi:hypothetical protein